MTRSAVFGRLSSVLMVFPFLTLGSCASTHDTNPPARFYFVPLSGKPLPGSQHADCDRLCRLGVPDSLNREVVDGARKGVGGPVTTFQDFSRARFGIAPVRQPAEKGKVMLVDSRFVVDRAKLGRQRLDAQLLADFAQDRLCERFLRLPATTGQLPATAAIAVADEEHPVVSIEDHGRRPQVGSPAEEVVV